MALSTLSITEKYALPPFYQEVKQALMSQLPWGSAIYCFTFPEIS